MATEGAVPEWAVDEAAQEVHRQINSLPYTTWENLTEKQRQCRRDMVRPIIEAVFSKLPDVEASMIEVVWMRPEANEFDSDGQRIKCSRCGGPYDSETDAWGLCPKCWEDADAKGNQLPNDADTVIKAYIEPNKAFSARLIKSQGNYWANVYDSKRYFNHEIEYIKTLAVPVKDEPSEPSKPDPAETDAPTFSRWEDVKRRREDIDRAAKRGCDEALAVVVKALRAESSGGFLTGVANRIAREQGGDGHE